VVVVVGGGRGGCGVCVCVGCQPRLFCTCIAHLISLSERAVVVCSIFLPRSNRGPAPSGFRFVMQSLYAANCAGNTPANGTSRLELR